MLLRRCLGQQAQTLTPISRLSSRLLSYLSERYGFVPPESLAPPQNPEPEPSPAKRKFKKLPYRPPSTLDRGGKPPAHSNLPFDFRFSYTEGNYGVQPIGLREPKYSPFGPGRLDREWTGICAPAIDPALRSADGDDPEVKARAEMAERAQRKRAATLGEPLSLAERAAIIEKCQRNRTKRQINLGRDGLTHNMLNDVYNSWKYADAIRIKCLGVPTVDMKNVCSQLEDKTGGLIIHRHGGMLILYRGRYYNPKRQPVIPLMLWKPHAPVYPRLIKSRIEGLTMEETKAMRKKGLATPVLTKLAKNGYYGSLVPMVRDAFLADELVRIDCKGLPESDFRKIGVKLRDLVPCILVTFDKEQIVVWRGKDYDPAVKRGDEKSFPPVVESLAAAGLSEGAAYEQTSANGSSEHGNFNNETPVSEIGLMFEVDADHTT